MIENAERLMQFIMMLRQRGITDTRVLQAIERIPREYFVPENFQDHAYSDMALPIASGQTISQPAVVGRMTQALEVGPRHKVLEIGTGSGYQAAILSQLARRVYTVERHRPLALKARGVFEALELVNLTTIIGDGSKGLPEQAPFDRILITAAAEDVPTPLLEQLKEGGVMVLPVGQSEGVQTLLKVTRGAQGPEYDELGEVRFVPLVEGIAPLT